MKKEALNRREFIKKTSTASVGLAMVPGSTPFFYQIRPVYYLIL